MKKSLSTLIWAGRLLVIFLFASLIGALLDAGYQYYNSIRLYFFKVLYEDSLMWIFIVLPIIFFYLWDIRKDSKINFKKVCAVLGVIVLVITIINNCLPVMFQYEAVKINGKRPSKFEYKWNLFIDSFGYTNTAEIKREDVDSFSGRYQTFGRRRTRSRFNKNSYTMVKFNTLSSSYTVCEESNVSVYIEDIAKYKGSVEFEYYPSSGMIKAIEGIERNDTNKLRKYVSELEKEYADEYRKEYLDELEKYYPFY